MKRTTLFLVLLALIFTMFVAVALAANNTEVTTTVNFPGIEGAEVRYYTNVSGWKTVGTFDDICEFATPEGVTSVQVVKGGMWYTFSGLSVGDGPLVLDAPIIKLMVLGIADDCNLGVIQEDWVYSSTPAEVDAPNYYNVFDNGKNYKVQLYRPGFYPITVTAVKDDEYYESHGASIWAYFDNFYQVTIPAGFTDVWISSYDWAVRGANAGDKIALLKDPSSVKDAKMRYTFEGTTYNVDFKLDGTYPFVGTVPGLSEVKYTPQEYPIKPMFFEVTVNDDFWEPLMKLNAEISIPHVFSPGNTRGSMEAAIYSLQRYPNPELQAQIEAYFESRKEAQAENPTTSYGLFESVVAYYKVTGDKDLLDAYIRSADLIYSNALTRPPSATGEVNSINFIEMYEATKNTKYLDMAKYYLDLRGSSGGDHYDQAHMPVLLQKEAAGHAVKFADMCVSLARTGTLTGLEGYLDAAKRLWDNVVEGKLYLTGGIGSTFNHEGFERSYMLPNVSAYCESCATIMFIELSHYLFLATGDSKYVDVMERAMYNGSISGLAVSGNKFFYSNPLGSIGRYERHEQYTTNCCPPRINRFLAIMPKYIYGQSSTNDDIYVNLYVSSKSTFEVNGKQFSLSQESEMPWEGNTAITVSEASDEGVKADIKLRIPGWSRNQPVPSNLYAYEDPNEQTQIEKAVIAVNGEPVNYTVDKFGYVSIDRVWKNDDVISVKFPLEIKTVTANSNVEADRDRIAFERGPIVYCAEWVDNDGHVLDMIVDPNSKLDASWDSGYYGNHFAGLPYNADFYSGIVTLTGEWKSGHDKYDSLETKPLKLIPYYLWANRGPGHMAIWLPTTAEAAMSSMPPAPPETIAGKSKVTVSETGGHTNIGGIIRNGTNSMAYKALNDGLYPTSSEQWKTVRDIAPALHFWHSGTMPEWTWVQYEFDIPRVISEVEICWHDGSPPLSLGKADDYRLLYKLREEDEWIPVEITNRQELIKDDSSAYWDSPETGVCTTYWASQGSMWSIAEFQPLEAKFLRLEMQRYNHEQSIWTATYILEWIVK